MDERQCARMLEVMRALRFFFTPASTTEAFDFVEDRIQRNDYDSLLSWMDDVESTIRKHEDASRDPSYQALCRHARQKFHKLCNAQRLFTMETWCTYVARVKEQAVLVMESAPPKVKAKAAPLLTKLVRARPVQMITDRELHNFVSAASKLTDDDDHQALIHILRDEGEDASELTKLSITIDLTKLKLCTIHRLRTYVQQALGSRGLAYPD
jgi:hypothetical protein